MMLMLCCFMLISMRNITMAMTIVVVVVVVVLVLVLVLVVVVVVVVIVVVVVAAALLRLFVSCLTAIIAVDTTVLLMCSLFLLLCV